MFDLPAFRNAFGRVPPGYGERHVRKVWVGTGEARLCSLVSKDRRYKPMVKSDGAQRESDGVVVPLIAGMNPAGGKDPDFGRAGRGGKREGMAGTARSNYPEGRHVAPAKVRQLQNRLWAAAKQSEGRRFHALYDRIYRSDVLWEAWERVRANRGAAGVDGVTLAAVEDYGVHRMLDELAQSLRAGVYGAVWITYQPSLAPAQIQQLRAFEARQSRLQGGSRYIDVSPNPGLAAPVVISSWGYQLRVDSPSDPRLQQFVNKFRNSATYSPEYQAPCTGGTGKPLQP